MIHPDHPASIYERDLADLSGKYLAVARELPPAADVLELGCASGYFAQALQRQGHRVIGLEGDADAVSACRQRGVEAFTADLSSPQALQALAGRQFDAVLCMDILEHLPYPSLLIRALTTVLKPNGKIIVTGPNVAFFAVRLNLLRGRWETSSAGVMDETHLRWFTRDTWRRLLAHNGFVVERVDPVEWMAPKEGLLAKLGLLEIVRKILVKVAPTWVTVVYILVGRVTK